MSNNEESTPKLTERMQAFCEWYVSLRNGAESARRAGYSATSEKSISVQVANLLGNPRVRAEIERIKKERSVEYTKEDAITFLTTLISAPVSIFYDDNWQLKPLSEIPTDYHCYIQRVTSKKGEITMEVMSKADAQTKLAKLLKWEGADVSIHIGLSDDELDKKIREMQTALGDGVDSSE